MSVASVVVDYQARYQLFRLQEMSDYRFVNISKGFCRLSSTHGTAHVIRQERRGPIGACGITVDLSKAVPAEDMNVLCKSCARWLQRWYERRLVQSMSDRYVRAEPGVYAELL
jgi:hypothetical protein